MLELVRDGGTVEDGGYQYSTAVVDIHLGIRADATVD